MTAEDVVREIYETYSEWIEMSENPQQFVVGVLANKIVDLQHYVDYLERRVNHVCSNSTD
jgi:hypothetical protein